MACIDAGAGVVFCVPQLDLRRRVVRCPVCECMTEMVLCADRNPCYSPSLHCCKCGDVWSEGCLRDRPFARGWREDAVRKHRAMWADATYGDLPAPDFEGVFAKEGGAR